MNYEKKKYEKETGTEMNINWKKAHPTQNLDKIINLKLFFSNEDNTGIENEFEGKKISKIFKNFIKL